MEILGSSAVSAAVEALIKRAVRGLFGTASFEPWDRVGRAVKRARARDTQMAFLPRSGDDRAFTEFAASVLAACSPALLARLDEVAPLAGRA